MKKKLTSGLVMIILLSACSTSTRLYDTPAVYFGDPHKVPITDNEYRLAGSASFILPVNADIQGEYRFTKKTVLNFSYSGNFGQYTQHDDNRIGKYFYSTNAFEAGLGFIDRIGKGRVKWFLLSGYGRGSSKSLVPEYGESEEFVYEGKYSKLTFTPGLLIPAGKMSSLSISWRQSFIKFEEYKMPGFVFKDKKQFLTDMMVRYSYQPKRVGVHFSFGCFINGKSSGVRQEGIQEDIWRIQRLYSGVGVNWRIK